MIYNRFIRLINGCEGSDQMKKLLLGLVVILMFGLTGCQDKKPILFAPDNLSFNDTINLLTWDKDEKALSYKLTIDGEVIETKENHYDMSQYEYKQYTVRVRSVYENEESLDSTMIYVVVKDPRPVVITIKDNAFHITKLDNVTYHYTMVVDITKKSGETTTGMIPIPSNFQERKFNLNLTIQHQRKVLHAFDFEVNLLLNQTFKTEDLIIETTNPKAVYIDGKEIEATLSADQVIISKAVINNLAEEVILTIISDEYVVQKLYVIDPIVTIKKATINASDPLEFIFEPNGFEFIGFGTTPFKINEDYFYNAGVLTFSDTFIEKYKTLHPESKMISLLATFTRGDLTSLITIQIKLDA